MQVTETIPKLYPKSFRIDYAKASRTTGRRWSAGAAIAMHNSEQDEVALHIVSLLLLNTISTRKTRCFADTKTVATCLSDRGNRIVKTIVAVCCAATLNCVHKGSWLAAGPRAWLGHATSRTSASTVLVRVQRVTRTSTVLVHMITSLT